MTRSVAGLEAAGKSLGLPEDKAKLTTGRALIRYFCTPCKPTSANGQRTRNLPHHDLERWELFREYCRQDVTAEMEVERRLAGEPRGRGLPEAAMGGRPPPAPGR